MIQVFSTEWFAKHRRILCKIANSPLGERIFEFGKMGHYTYHEIVDITPNSVAEIVSVKNGIITLKRHFFNKNEYALRLKNAYCPIWSMIHAWDMGIANRLNPDFNLGFDTLTVNPDAGTGGGNVSVDGTVYRTGVTEAWATLIAGAGNGFWDTQANIYFIDIYATTTSNVWDTLRRSIFLFDTHTLTAGAIISSAVLSLYGTAKADSGTAVTPDLNIYTSTPAANNALANGDYSQLGSVAQCDVAITYAGFNTAGYNDFTLNATGLGNISKTGISKFGARNANYDVAAVAPTWSSISSHYLQGYFSDNGSNKPKLVITYTAPKGQNLITLMGCG